MAFVNEKTEDGKYITIDREKGLLLTRVGQIAAEPIYIFDFTEDGKTVQVFAERKFYFREMIVLLCGRLKRYSLISRLRRISLMSSLMFLTLYFAMVHLVQLNCIPRRTKKTT